MRYRKSRGIAGRPKNVTVSIVAGKVFVSIQTEREVEPVMHPSTSLVGVDWGVVNFVTMSNGEVVGQCAPLEQHARKLAKWQRRLARTRVGDESSNGEASRIARFNPGCAAWRIAGSHSSREHQPLLSGMRSRSSGEPQDTSKVRLCCLWIPGASRLGSSLEHQRGGTRLVSLHASFGCSKPVMSGTRRRHRCLADEPVGILSLQAGGMSKRLRKNLPPTYLLLHKGRDGPAPKDGPRPKKIENRCPLPG